MEEDDTGMQNLGLCLIDFVLSLCIEFGYGIAECFGLFDIVCIVVQKCVSPNLVSSKRMTSACVDLNGK